MRADAQKNSERLMRAAREVLVEQGAAASLRDIARRADVVVGTLYRHFPTRDALLASLLHAGFLELAAAADDLGAAPDPTEALVRWMRDCVAFTHEHRGMTTVMMTAIEDPDSALHASCSALRAAGARLLERAQAAGTARKDLTGDDLFALINALAWLAEQPSSADRADHLFDVILDAVVPPARAAA